MNPLKEENPLGPNCLRAPKCEMKARSRGLCDVCYRACQRAIKDYNLTWEILEKHHKCLPRQRVRSQAYEWTIDWKKRKGRKPGPKPKLTKIK